MTGDDPDFADEVRRRLWEDMRARSATGTPRVRKRSGAPTIYNVTFTESSAFYGAWVNQPLKEPASLRLDTLLPPGSVPDSGARSNGVGTGFPATMPRPLIQFERKHTADVSLLGRYVWLLTERAKEVFEKLDAPAFVFCEAQSRLRDGSDGPSYWLSDVVRFLDALDPEGSGLNVQVTDEGVRRTHSAHVGLGADAAFRRDVIGSSHIFRLFTEPSTICCDQTMRDAIKDVKLSGIACSTWGYADA
jgi:hypothetical protein